MIKIKDGKYLSLILFTLFLFLSDINVFAFNTIIPNTSGTNIQSNIHSDQVATTGNSYYYRTHTGGVGYGNFGSVYNGRLNGIQAYVESVPLIGGRHYRLTLQANTTDFRSNWLGSNIKICLDFFGTYDCVQATNITLTNKASNNSSYWKTVSFDFNFPNIPYDTQINNNWLILVNGKINTSNGLEYPSLGLNNLDLTGDSNWKIDWVNLKIISIDNPPTPVDPDDPNDPDDPLDNSGSITELLQENNSWLKKIHDKLDKFFDTSIDTTSFNNFFNNLSQKIPGNQIVTGLITLPNTVLTGLNNGLLNSCSPVVFGELYGTELSLPCFSPSDYLGSTIWGIIDLIFTCMLGWGWSRQLVKIYDSVTTLSKEGDIID